MHKHLSLRRQLLRCLPVVMSWCAGLGLSHAHAQSFPNKPIRWVVVAPAGSSLDVIARAMQDKLKDNLGQSVVIENKPGTGGGIGATYVAKAPADGYTLLGGTISTHAINASLYKNLPYDPVKDFEPVSLVAFLPNVLLVGAQSGINSVAELIAVLKKDETRRTFASSGAGTSTHLAGELMADLINVPLTHIAYKGTPPAMMDVAAGQVTFMFDQLTAAIPLIQAGKLKLLAVGSLKRSPLFPNVPTLDEAGLKGFDADSVFGFYAPAGTPADVVNRVNREINKILGTQALKDRIQNLGGEALPLTPAEFGARAADDSKRFGAIIRERKIVGD